MMQTYKNRYYTALITIASFILVISVFAVHTNAQGPVRGLIEQPAPSWVVDNWINLPDGIKSIDVSDYQGKVLYLYFFQSWCPGCHKYGFPTLQKLISSYKENINVEFVAIQTTFEGYSTNDFRSAKKTAKQYSLEIPVGHSGTRGRPSKVMRHYRSGGTPWTIIIDQDGIVKYNDFHIQVDQATKLIDKLIEEKQVDENNSTMPDSRGGSDMIGKKFDLAGLKFANKSNPFDPTGKVSLVRWWTDTCPYCTASLPAIEQLTNQINSDTFQTLAVYHPKPPRPTNSEQILSTAKKFGYSSNVAVDLNWDVLDKNYLSTGNRSATSVTFILDKQGIVRFVHPGPEFQSSSDANKSQENQDYEDIKLAIEFLLNE